MSTIELEYLGKDLVISREVAEKKLGLHPGDRIEVRPKLALTPIPRSPEETSQITETLERLRAAFHPADLDDWETQRDKIWASWTDRT